MRTCFAAFVGLLAVSSCDDDTSTSEGVGGGGAELVCNPGQTRSCYDGPVDTENVGACESGVQVCLQHGRGWGDCVGQTLPTQEICDEPADENCDGSTSCGQTIWANRFGVERDEVVYRVDTDDAGNVYFAGFYRAPVDLGAGELPTIDNSIDSVIAKYDVDGNHVFSVAIYAETSVLPKDIAVSPSGDAIAFVADVNGEIFLDGELIPPNGDNDVLLVMLDGDGEVVWYRRFGDDDEQFPFGVGLDTEGNVYVTGFFSGELDFGSGEPLTSAGFALDAYVAKLDDSGEEVWSRAYNAPLDQVPRAIAVASDRVFVTGRFAGRVDFGGGELEATAETSDAFLLALDADGEHVFSRAWGGEGHDEAWSVAVDGDGHAVITGRFEKQVRFGPSLLESAGAGSIFVTKVDEAGNDLWAERIGGSSEQGGTDVMIDSRDRVIVTGYYEGAIPFGEAKLPPSGLREPNILVAKLEPDGAPVWARGIAVDGNQDTGGVGRGWRSVALLPGDFIALGGFAEREIDFGDGALEAFGGTDFLLAKLAP